MLRVPTYVAPSPIAGMGVFAAKDIEAGTVVWSFEEGVDWRIHPEEFEAFPEPYRTRFRHYVYLEDTGFYVLCGDNTRFMNHSDMPNCEEPPGAFTIASRLIKAGEELTCDYRIFDRESREMGLDFEVVRVNSSNGAAHAG
jgi:uncharacterized protein